MILFALKESLHVIHGLDLTQTMSSPVLSLLFKLPKLKTTERKKNSALATCSKLLKRMDRHSSVSLSSSIHLESPQVNVKLKI